MILKMNRFYFLMLVYSYNEVIFEKKRNVPITGRYQLSEIRVSIIDIGP